MTSLKRHVIADPYPESIGVSALTIFAPEDFSASALLQGVFHDVRGARPTADEHLPALNQLTARVVALVVHAFYKQRIEKAARLEAAYQWQSYEEK